jgi:hypothetical protein
MWLDGDFASNTNTTWVDRTGNGNSAVATPASGSSPPLGASAPVLTPAAVNGRQAYAWSAANHSYMNVPAFAAGPTGCTVFAVFKSSSAGLIGYQASIDAFYSKTYSLEYSSGSGFGVEFWWVGVDYLGNFSGGPAVDTNTHVMVMNVTVGTGWSCAIDGTSLATGLFANAPVNPTIRYIGYFESFSQDTWDGYLCEFLEYDFALTPLQQAQNVTGLKAKWGIT